MGSRQKKDPKKKKSNKLILLSTKKTLSSEEEEKFPKKRQTLIEELEHDKRTEVEILEKLQKGQKGEGKIKFPIVGIGGSAGSLETLQILLEELSNEGDMSYVIIQHLDPNHESSLARILSRSTKIPIIEASEGLKVEVNRIYIIPPNVTLFISEGLLRIRARRSGLHSPIDSFFNSLANELGRFAIGVIISGTGSDGVRGIEAIKTEGGIVFAQDTRTAKFAQMPLNAIASGCVDFILSPKDIAHELSRISQDPNLAKLKEIALIDHLSSEDKSAYRRILNLLNLTAKVDFTNYKQSTIQRRLYRRMLVHKIAFFSDYVVFLKKNPSEVQALYNEFLINVTSFFRNPLVFQTLKDVFIPEILRTSDSQKAIRIWVPGCSSGQEVYSILICFCEILGENYLNFRIQAFATDISEITIEQARVGIYPASISDEVSPQRLNRFFVQLDDGRYQIKKFIREMCIFAKQNVSSDPPFSNIDLISCRNLLIYFDTVLQKKVIPIFHYSLKNSGLLLLGSSESINSFPELFTVKDKTHSIYSKTSIGTKKPYFDFVARSFYQANFQPEAKHNFQKLDPLQELRLVSERMMIEMFAPCSVVVNEELEIIHSHGDTSPFLSLKPGTATLNILKMAKDLLTVELRILLHKAKKEAHSVKKENIKLKIKEETLVVDIEVLPIESPKIQGRNFLIVFSTLKESEGTIKKDKKTSKAKTLNTQRRQDISADKQDKIKALMNEIDDLKEALRNLTEGFQSTIEEQEAINEEIKASNEELQSSNEELQSTAEELETAKEELHSTNEELGTVNIEVQNRNTELTQANSDLANLLESVRIPVVMLDRDIKIRKLTPSAQKLFNLIPSDIGRPISDIQSSLIIPNLQALIKDVITTCKSQEHETQDADEHWYLLRIQPYLTREKSCDGVVLIALDINELKTSLKFTQSIIDSLQNAVVVIDNSMKFFAVNAAFYALFQISKTETETSTLFNFKNGILDIPELRKFFRATNPENIDVHSIHLNIVIKMENRALLLNARNMNPEIPGLKLMTLLSIQDLTEIIKV